MTEKISNTILLVLSFLMPLFFLPFTSEFFEFGKLNLLVLATIALVFTWVAKIISTQKIELTKSTVDIPLLAFTLTVILSTVFSINKTASIYGSQGRWFPSLIGTAILVTFYYAISSNIKSVSALRNALAAVITGVTLASFAAILNYFGLQLGEAAYLKMTGFTLGGSVTSSVVLAAIFSAVSLALVMHDKRSITKILALVAATINFTYLALVGNLTGWLTLAIGILAALVLAKQSKLVAGKVYLLVLVGILTAITLVTVLPSTRTLIANKNYPREISLPFRESWMIAASTIQEFPLLATGPSTFYLNFSRYRPLALNNLQTWNIRFDKPYNELFNIIATLGIIGIVAAAFLGYTIAKTALKARASSDDSGITAVLATGVLTALSVFLFTYATVITAFVCLLLLGLLMAAFSLLDKQSAVAESVTMSFSTFSSVTSLGELGTVKKEYFHLVMVAPVLAAALYAGYLTYRTVAAEVYTYQALVAAQLNDGTKTYALQAKSINTNPKRDTYQIMYAQTNLALANNIAAKGELSDSDKQTVQTLISQAIRSVRVATEVLNPMDPLNWEARANLYRNITGVADNATDWAISAYNTAIQLDPTNPRLRLELGGVYFAKEDYLSAATQFRQAAALKQDYANAHYNFAQALLKLNDLANAKRELELTKTLLPQDSDDAKKVDEEIAAINANPAVAGASTEKTTVEALEQSGVKEGDKTEPATQEPLTKVGE